MNARALESPARFLAVPFETALDMFAKAKRDEAILIEESVLEDTVPVKEYWTPSVVGLGKVKVQLTPVKTVMSIMLSWESPTKGGFE